MELTVKEAKLLYSAQQLLSAKLNSEKIKLSSAKAVIDLLMLELAPLGYEVFHVIYLRSDNTVIERENLFRGTIDGAAVYPREVAKRCLETNAAAVIFAHNHPSGSVTPSHADRTITTRLTQALALLDVRVLDHVVVGNGAFSFAEHGLI